jgi:signal transduction histidine kinase
MLGMSEELAVALALVAGVTASWLVAQLLRRRRHLALVAANRKLESQLRERSHKLHAFAVELIRAEEEQRARIARELHDSLGQMMTAVNIGLEVLKESQGADEGQRRAQVEDLRALAAQVMGEMRRISQELRPAVLDEVGLSEAVRALSERMARHAQIPIDCLIDGEVNVLPADSAIACYRLVQEALNNVVKHSGATRASVYLVRKGGTLSASVTDNGKGIDYDPATLDGHYGIMGLQERISALGGRFAIGRPGHGSGTRITADFPVGLTTEITPPNPTPIGELPALPVAATPASPVAATPASPAGATPTSPAGAAPTKENASTPAGSLTRDPAR